MSRDPWGDVRGAREAASVTREMLDPSWTPEAGYSHAARLMALLDLPVTGGKTVRDLTDNIGRGVAK